MSLTPEEQEARRDRVGASDVAAIMGVPTFAGVNAWTVWADKTRQLEARTETASMAEGHRLEPWILERAEAALGPLERNVVVHDPSGAPIASTLDGLVLADRHPVEAKTSGILGPMHGTWGDAGTDEVPDGYLLQAQTQLLCTGADLCHLFALLGGRGLTHYEIRPEPRLVRKIRDVASDFFEQWVVMRRDPRDGWAERLEQVHGIRLTADPCAPVLDAAKRLRRTSGKSIEAGGGDAELVLSWDTLRAARLEAEKAEKAALAGVLTFLGDAEEAELPDGRRFTYREQRQADLIDREAMKAAGIYERFATPNTARVARLTGGASKPRAKREPKPQAQPKALAEPADPFDWT